MSSQISWPFRAVLGMVVLILILLGSPAGAEAGSKPPVLPVQSNPHGASYGEWSAAWWQWAFSMPIDQHPLYDTADCSAGQSGKVWFLGGAFQFDTTSAGDVVAIKDRSCTIPTGTFLFIPVINSEAATLEGNGTTEAELRAAAKSFQDAAANLSLSIDDVYVPSLNNYRVQSPLYTYGPLPDNNVLQAFGFDAPVGATSLSAADGVYVMVKPLSVGNHTIRFLGEVPAFRLLLDITYGLTVVPRGQY